MVALRCAPRFGFAALVAMAMLASIPMNSCAATGEIRITITRPQFIVGGGSGTLRLYGERYPLRVGGVSAGPLGSARVDLVGRAYNLRNAASVHGIYSTVPGNGRSGMFRLRNWHGVVLELRGRQGVKPSVDLNGLQISLR